MEQCKCGFFNENKNSINLNFLEKITITASYSWYCFQQNKKYSKKMEKTNSKKNSEKNQTNFPKTIPPLLNWLQCSEVWTLFNCKDLIIQKRLFHIGQPNSSFLKHFMEELTVKLDNF